MPRNTMKLQSFDCEADPHPPDTPAAVRPSERSRSFDLAAPYHTPSLHFFDCETVELPDGALAVPRPDGKERQLSVAKAIAQRAHVEQKVVSILLTSIGKLGAPPRPPQEHFGSYLSEGWRVKQLTSLPTGSAEVWLIALLEREPNKPLQQPDV